MNFSANWSSSRVLTPGFTRAPSSLSRSPTTLPAARIFTSSSEVLMGMLTSSLLGLGAAGLLLLRLLDHADDDLGHLGDVALHCQVLQGALLAVVRDQGL